MKTRLLLILLLGSISNLIFGQQTCIPDKNGIYITVDQNPKELFDFQDFFNVLLPILKIHHYLIEEDVTTYHFTFIIDEQGNTKLSSINEKSLSAAQKDEFLVNELLKPFIWKPGQCNNFNVATQITIPLKWENK
jgi:hypothetical protein